MKVPANDHAGFYWLLELCGKTPTYLSTAVSGLDGPIGFTSEAWDAWRFPTKDTAELVAALLNGAFGARAVEHGFHKR